MAIALALCSALSYGVADFFGGLASRRTDARLVTVGTLAVGLIIAAVATVIYPGQGPSARALAWGAAGGLGSAVGLLSLYRGFSRGSVSVVAPVAGVLTAVIPVVVGLGLGNRLSALELLGVVLTVPAIGLVSRETPAEDGHRGGARDGVLAGVGFGLLFVALAQAGNRSGAWPFLPTESISLACLVPVALTGRAHRSRPSRSAVGLTLTGGLLSGTANLLYLVAVHHGQLAIVGVISSLYPAGTVLLARVWLSERWNRVQIAGMVLAVVAVVLVAT